MNMRINPAVIISIVLIGVFTLLTGIASGEEAKADQNLSEKSVTSFRSEALGRDIKITIYSNSDDTDEAPVVIYLKGLAEKRLGSIDDETLIEDFMSRGYIVVCADYEKDRAAKVPAINLDILKLRTELEQLTEGLSVNAITVLLIPAGYTFQTDVVIFPDGIFKMDVRYPAGDTEPVPVVLQSSHNKKRSSNEGYLRANDSFCDGFVCRGYASATVDHAAKGRLSVMGKLGLIEPSMLADPETEEFVKILPVKAAIRVIRANAAKWNIDGDHLGLYGNSKGSIIASLAVTTVGRKDLEEIGPFTEESNKVQVAHLSSGQHDFVNMWADKGEDKKEPKNDSEREALASYSPAYLVNKTTCPLFLAAGEDDTVRAKQITRMANACRKAGIDYKLHLEPGLEHSVMFNVEVIARQHEFFDRYLREAEDPNDTQRQNNTSQAK